MNGDKEFSNTKAQSKPESVPESKKPSRSRRRVLSTVAAGVGATTIAGCLGSSETDEPTDNSPLRVEVYGGIFKEVMDEQLINPFREETGIPVESESGLSASQLSRINAAVNAGETPVDLFAAQPTQYIRGHEMGLWHTHDPSAISSSGNVIPEMMPMTDDSELIGVGAFGVYESLLTNLDVIDDPVSTWKALWDEQYEEQFAVGQAFDNYLIDITAHIFDEFDSQETLETESGITSVLEKVQEIKPQVTTWFNGEAEAQEGMQRNDLGAAKYYNDVALVLEEQDASKYDNVVPDEGLLKDHRAWVIPESSPNVEAAQEFLNYSLRPEVQKRITEELYTAPVLERDSMDISDDLYTAVHGPESMDAIEPNHQMYIDREEWLDTQWRDMVLP
jgi:putative spermidine/putrescine transport system substrate-binding protein